MEAQFSPAVEVSSYSIPLRLCDRLAKPEYLYNFSRVYRAIEVWRSILLRLMNVKSCAPTDYPDLAGMRAECEHFLQQNAAEYNLAAEKANAIITHLTPPMT